MKRYVKTALLACTLCGTFAPLSYAQVNNADAQISELQLFEKQLDAWSPAQLDHRASTNSSGSSSPAGKIGVKNMMVSTPYSELLTFYARKYGFTSFDFVPKASLFEASGSTGMSSGPNSISISNRPEALSATFVRLDPQYTMTTTLFRSKRDDLTLVTMTLIEQNKLLKP